MPLNGARPAFFGSVALVLGNRANAHWQITVDKAREYLDRIRRFQETEAHGDSPSLPKPTGLYISGAEPFSQIDDLENLLDRAGQNKMVAEVATSVFWAASEASVNSVLQRLSRKIHLLTILAGRDEIDRHGLASFERLLLGTRRFNMSFQLHVGVGGNQPFPKELLGLEVINCDTSVIRVEPVSDGRAASHCSPFPRSYLLEAPPKYARCAELMGFVIAPVGDVYPCMSGIGSTQLRIGNMETQSVQEIMRAAMVNDELGKLRSDGPFFLYEAWRDSRQTGALPRGFTSSCDFHRWLLANAKPSATQVDDRSQPAGRHLRPSGNAARAAGACAIAAAIGKRTR